MYNKLVQCLESVRSKTDFKPEVALILGSGLGDFADEINIVDTIEYTNDKDKIIVSVNASDINAGDGIAKIKISIPEDIKTPNIGDEIKLNAGIYKPSPASGFGGV